MKLSQMKLNKNYVVLLTLIGCGACSSPMVMPEKTPLPEVPEYAKVPHPAGFELVDLKAIFLSPMAPTAVLGEFADTCDETFKKLTKVTQSHDELSKGTQELVAQDPERMHWCFYAKISRLQDSLQSDTTWSSRQKKVLETFEFLSPVANAYLNQFHDSRYYRWASLYYSKVSEWVFFRKVTPTAENTQTIMATSRTELEPWVPVEKETKTGSILTKYGISLMPSVATGPATKVESKTIAAETKREPASVEEAAPTAVGLDPSGAEATSRESSDGF